MHKKLVFACLVVTMVFSLIMVPSSAWVYPDCTEDERYEKFGPRCDRLLINLYSHLYNEFDAFEACEIDMVDWPLSREYLERWSTPPYNETIKIVASGAEYGMYLIDINNNPNEFLGNPPDPAYPNPVYPNPCSVCCFRHALAHLMDRDYVVSVIEEGLGIPMYTMMPPSCPGFVHPEIRPGGALEDLCHLYNCTEAQRILDECDEAPADGMPDFPVNPGTGWRFWDRNGNGVEDPGEYLELEFYIRVDQPFEHYLGDWYSSEVETCLQVRVNRIYMDGYGCWLHVVIMKDFHLYTGYWRMPMNPYLLLSNPYHLFTLYHSSNYWHPCFCPNFNFVNCSEFDYWVEQLMFASTYSEAIDAAYYAQEAFATPCCIGKIPVKCEFVYKAYKRRYVGGTSEEEALGYTGQLWKGGVNKPGFGIDNWYSFLNMYPEGHLMGDCEHMTIRWGFKVDRLKMLNPLYAFDPHDWNVLHLIYDSLLQRDPHTYELIPHLAKQFEVDTWVDPLDGLTKSKVKFTLRSDVCWHDGVPFSAADIMFTLYELPQLLMDVGLSPPWWWNNVRFVKGFKLIDPCNIEVLLDVLSIWATEWVGLNIILPKHVWLPIIESFLNTGMPYPKEFSPDPNLIGTGPWRLQEYIEGWHILLLANKPGLTVQTNLWNELGPAEPITNPRGFYDWCPVHVNVHIIDPPEYEYRQKIPNCTYVTFQIDLHNQWLNPIPNTAGSPNTGLLWVLKYVWIVYPDGTEVPIVYEEFLELPACEHHLEYVTEHFEPCHHQLKVAVHIVGPELVEVTKEDSTIWVPNPFVCQWINYTFDFWVTIKEDIAGSCFDMWHGVEYPVPGGVAGYWVPWEVPAPDCKVDMFDVATAAKAFGSCPGYEGWNPVADINGDYIIGMFDIFAISIQYGWGGDYSAPPPPPVPQPHEVFLIANINKTVACVGCNFTVYIDITDVTNLFAYDIKLNYNTTLVEFLYVYKLTPPKGWGTSYEVVPGQMAVSGRGAVSPFTGSRGLAVINFTCKVKGELTMDVSGSMLIAAGSQVSNILYTAVDDSITISYPGDITGGTADPWDFVPDGKVGGIDISIVARCLGSWPEAQPPMIWHPNCDIDNDQRVSGVDLTTVAKHLGEEDP